MNTPEADLSVPPSGLPLASKALAAEALVRQFWTLMATNDFRQVKAVLSDDFVLDWPQSNERICGADRFVQMNAEYPSAGRWTFEVQRLVAQGDAVATAVRVSDGTQTALALSWFTVAEDRIVRLVEYWPEPFAPNANRSHLTQPID